ncbi:uncharacterized protein LOC116778621 [Danaus plexippus]|uniref:uncharacterized protein LOC116778621 n=1 Tax=Danaus plexippus TaxID=13037 RepID=UPI002AAF91EC|nr:uncharacterized protein LOC116778621 [Danaus plexippus]
MWTFTVLLVFTAICGTNSEPVWSKPTEKSIRQKRLLFYDEQGQLVKTYGSPLYHFGQREQENLFHWSFLNMFLSPVFPTTLGRNSITYMVPVSDAVIHQIDKDPFYQNKVFVLTYKDPVVETNPLCAGKRTQIPSPKMCNNFLNCWDGWAVEQECPADLLFSSEGFCDYPYNVDCNNRKVPERPEPACKTDFEVFSSRFNCSEFFVCVNSIPVKFQCPADLAYSEYLGVCDYPYRVECNTTEATKPSITQSTEVPEVFMSSTSPVSTMAPTSTSSVSTDQNVINKMEYNMHSWTSTHVAISRQDAIRQLQHEKIAQVKTRK